MDSFSYHLETFDGPLDLLLQMLSKNKLDICEVSILSIVDQYVEQVHAMQAASMDVASEFLEMAARLIEMKTAALLPRHEKSSEPKELVDQLLHYQECKRLASVLAQQLSFDLFVRPAEEIEPDQTYRRSLDPQAVLRAYQMAVGRKKRSMAPTPATFAGIVAHRIVSVSSQIVSVLRKLRTGREISYYSLYEGKQDRSERVATFLAVLELTKAGRISVDGPLGRETVRMRSTSRAGREREWKTFREP